MKKVFACQKCRQVYDGRPFESWSSGGVTIKANATDLCLGCAGDIAYQEALSMAFQRQTPTNVQEPRSGAGEHR